MPNTLQIMYKYYLARNSVSLLLSAVHSNNGPYCNRTQYWSNVLYKHNRVKKLS